MEYYPRIVELKLKKWLRRREIIIIKGPRQAGKTTLLLHLKEKLRGNYVTLEDPEMLQAFEDNTKEFAKRFKGNLFLDEVQYSKKAGKCLKLIYDLFPKTKIFVTGSGSFDIKTPVGNYLVGRAVYFELYPLSFEEFILWKARDLYPVFLNFKNEVKAFIKKGVFHYKKPVFENEFKQLLQEYILYGGFPAVVKEKDFDMKIQLLKSLQQTYLEKDIFFFFDVRHLEKFRDVLRFLSFNIGNLLQPSNLASDLFIDIRTLHNYLNILENTYIIKRVRPFFKNILTEIKKTRKTYFLDTGLRNSILSNFQPLSTRSDKGQLLENHVFIQLKKFGEIRYWRTKGKAEVDFVLVNNELIPIEVKSLGKVKKGFLSFLKTYKPKKAIVFSEKDFGIKKIERTKVLFIPHWIV